MRFKGWLLVVFAILFGVSAIRPHHPQDFLIEHALTVVALVGLIVLDRRRPISNTAAALIFGFLLLHVLGAHYTYSEVPYDRWSEALTGVSVSERLGWERNHYDRLVHLSFGLLLVHPTRELLARAFPELRPRDLRLLVGAVVVIAVLSKLYELLEWIFTLVMTEDAAALYNGEQGDVRDAHKDMTLALLGAIASAVVVGVVDARATRR